MSAGGTIVLALASLLASAAAAIAARVLRDLSRVELEFVCRQRKSEDLLREITQSQERAAVAAECLQYLCGALALATITLSVVTLPAIEPWDVWAKLALATTCGGLIWIVMNVILAGAAARAWGAGYIASTWPLWRAIARLLTPLVLLAQRSEALAQEFAGRRRALIDEPSFDGDARALLTDDQREESLEQDAREMIRGVIQLGDAEVAQVMTPRTYMLSLRASLPLEEAIELVISSGHTRLPVFDKNRDDIVGILHMKDLLPELVKPEGERLAPNVANLLRPAQFVPESKQLDELLQEFQQTRNHMAVVLDEFGGVSGLVTIEDVLEEIVGEIADEHDEALIEEIKSIDDHTAEALARVRIDDLNERLGTHLSEDGDFDTIGGFIFSHLGHIPVVGETVIADDVRLTVIDATRRRIERVRIEVLDPTRA